MEQPANAMAKEATAGAARHEIIVDVSESEYEYGYFAMGRCKTFELLSWPLLLWSRRSRSSVLYALFTPHELELVSLAKPFGEKKHIWCKSWAGVAI